MPPLAVTLSRVSLDGVDVHAGEVTGVPGDGQAADEVTDHVAGTVLESGRALVVSDAPGERRGRRPPSGPGPVPGCAGRTRHRAGRPGGLRPSPVIAVLLRGLTAPTPRRRGRR